MGFLDSIKKLFGKKDDQAEGQTPTQPQEAPAEDTTTDENQPTQ